MPKLKDIKGLMIDKELDTNCFFDLAINESIDKQGECLISIDYAKLEEYILDSYIFSPPSAFINILKAHEDELIIFRRGK